MAVLSLGAVAFFQRYQIVPRGTVLNTTNTITPSTTANNIPTASTTEIAVVPVGILFSSADISEQTASFTIRAFYPVMSGGESVVQSNFNNSVKTIVDKYIADFKKDAAGGVVVSSSLSSFTWAYDIKQQDDNLVSVLMSGEEYVTGFAHPTHPVTSFNYNLKTGQVINLDYLFKKDAKYLDWLSEYCRTKLNDRNVKNKFSDEAMIKAGTAPKKENFSVFNLVSDGLIMTFSEYQVAPYVAGASTITIPWKDLSTMLDSNNSIKDWISKIIIPTSSAATSSLQ